jgi:6-phosphogluconolactonase (cycloisomerase 2 family)
VIGSSDHQVIEDQNRFCVLGLATTQSPDGEITRPGEWMLRKTGVVLALVAMCVLSALLVNCGSGSERPAGLLYVISQAESDISSYSINLDSGSLTYINSNATTCNTASGSNPQSCGLGVSLMLDPSGSVAYLLNQGFSPNSVQPTIYGYGVNSDGSLGSPTVAATLSANPGETALAMTEDTGGDLLFVITNAPAIYVFTAKSGSVGLTQASVVPLTRMPTKISALTFTPQGGSAETLLFMTSNKDLTPLHNDNELSVYNASSSGTLTEQSFSPYTVPTVNPTVALAVNTQPVQQNTGGIFVYVGNQPGTTGSGSVVAFQVCTVLGRGVCTLPQQVQAQQLILVSSNPNTVGQNPVAMLVDPTNSFLYVLCNVTSNVYGFKIAGSVGTLSALTPANQPTGAQPVAMAIQNNYNNSGEFIYTSNQAGSSITGFSVNQTTGSISGAGTTIFLLGQPSGLAAR